jgi:hypothetical protein
MARTRIAEVAVSRYWRESEGRLVVAAWKRSGETLAGFAGRHGIHPDRVARWAKRVDRGVGKEPSFHPVRVVAQSIVGAGREPFELMVPNGTRVRVPVGFDAAELARLLAVVRAERLC